MTEVKIMYAGKIIPIKKFCHTHFSIFYQFEYLDDFVFLYFCFVFFGGEGGTSFL